MDRYIYTRDEEDNSVTEEKKMLESNKILQKNTRESEETFLQKALLAVQSNDIEITRHLPHVVVHVQNTGLFHDFCDQYASLIADYHVLSQQSTKKLACLHLFCGISKNELNMELQKVYDLERYKNRYYGTLCMEGDYGSTLEDTELCKNLKDFICDNSENIKFIFGYRKQKEREQILRLAGGHLCLSEVVLSQTDGVMNYGEIFAQILSEKHINVTKEHMDRIRRYYRSDSVKERYGEKQKGVRNLADDFYYFLYTEGLMSEQITLESLEVFLQSVGTKEYHLCSTIGFS